MRLPPRLALGAAVAVDYTGVVSMAAVLADSGAALGASVVALEGLQALGVSEVFIEVSRAFVPAMAGFGLVTEGSGRAMGVTLEALPAAASIAVLRTLIFNVRQLSNGV
ncbi:hypothetical protein [Methylocapsa sp. D3K7]|uniref:hypothetical protein n=1 Tax=Methylocapsa sp. D3K7 TaxID=3041435 RepID=UPI003296BA7F